MIAVLRAVLGRWPFSSGDTQERAGNTVTHGSSRAQSTETSRHRSAENGALPSTSSALPRDRSLLWSIVDTSSAVIYVKDREGRFLLVNRRFEELFHIARGDVVGKTDHDLFPAERAAAFRAVDMRVIAAGTTLEVEEMVPHDDGLHTYISVKSPVRNESGQVYAVCGISTDITERKRAEDGWRVSEERYRSLYDNTPAMMHSIDRAGRLISVSNLWLETLGYQRSEVIGRRSSDFLTPQSRRFAEEVVLPDFFETGVCKDVPYEFLTKNGETINVLLSAIAVRDQTGNMTGSLAVLNDVSGRLRAEEMLRRMAAIVESSGDAIVSVTPDLEVTSWNRGAEKIYGYLADEMLGTPILRIVPADRIDETRDAIARALKGEAVAAFETERLRKDGSRIPIALTVSPVEDAKGAISGISLIARDNTSRKEMEDAVRDSEQRFRDFAETASDWLWETDANHAFTFVSPPFRLLEADRAARLGQRRIDYADDFDDEPEKWRQHLADLERHEPFRDFIYRSKRKTDVGYVSTSGKPRFDAAGRFLGYRGTARDITLAVRGEEALHASEQRFRDFAETESDWLWETGPDHRMTWITQRSGSGRLDPNNRVGKRRWEYADDTEEEPVKWRQHRETLEQRRPFRDFVFRITTAEGIERYVSASGKPIQAADGTFLGYRGVGRDVTDAVRAQHALREGEERLELAIEAGQMGTWDYDVRRQTVHWSPRLVRLFGFRDNRAMLSLEDSFTYIHPDDRVAVAKNLATALEWHARYRDEFRLNVADGERWIASHGIVVTDAANEPVRMVGVVQDITLRKRAEVHQKFLLDELNHRVKNTLLTVQSVAMQMARETDSPKQFYQGFKARLLALSNAHDLLTRGAWQGASLRELLQRTLAPYAGGATQRVVITGEDIRLKPRAALGMAMAFQELATNAAKHGALSAAEGRITVDWRAEPPGSNLIEIRWIETGGPSVVPPRRRGFGTRLLERGLAYELKAEVKLDFAPTGLRCRIRLPL